MVIDCPRAALAACGALEMLLVRRGRRAECAVWGGKEVAAGSSRGGAPIYCLGPYPARAPPRRHGGDFFSPAHGALRAPPSAQNLEGATHGERSTRTVYHHYVFLSPFL